MLRTLGVRRRPLSCSVQRHIDPPFAAPRAFGWHFGRESGGTDFEVFSKDSRPVRGSPARLADLDHSGLDFIVATGATKYQLACITVIAKFDHEG
jgi:hypothetical protein